MSTIKYAMMNLMQKGHACRQAGFTPIIILVGLMILIVVGGGAYFFGKSQTIKPQPAAPKACTEEAMVCPDGSAVGRVGPNCEFAPCPGENKTDKIITPSNPAEPSSSSTAQEYKIGGSFTEQATEAEIGSLSSKLGSDASSISLLESFPLQFQIISPSSSSCEKVKTALSSLKFISSVGECQKIESGISEDSNQSIKSQ